jgi:hypothetical protein
METITSLTIPTDTPDNSQYHEGIIASAKEMYLRYISFNRIADAIFEQTGRKCSQSLVKYWADNQGWAEERNRIMSRVNQEISGRITEEMIERQVKQRELYQKMQRKGEEALDDGMVVVEKMGEAVQLIDTGVKGERQINSALVSLKYIELVVSIISEEVKDEETKRRIAKRLQKATENILSF